MPTEPNVIDMQRRTALAIEAGERMRSSDAEVLARSARRSAEAARRQLREAAGHQAEEGASWSQTLAVDAAWEALEIAEKRAARFGDQKYDPDHSFFVDVFAAEVRGDKAALRRLKAFSAEVELRAGLGISSTFVAPAFLTSQYADIPRQAQVFAALVPQRPLPKGASLSIPQFSASGSVSSAAQNVAPSETDIVDVFLARAVGWLAGRFTASLQLIEQSWSPAFDEVAEEVLTAAFDETLEGQMFTGSGSAGQVLGVLNAPNLVDSTFNQTSPTPSECAAAIGEGLAVYAAARKMTASAVLMTPLRWAWLANGQDTTGRPLVNLTGPVARTANGTTPVGSIGGVNVYTTAGIPTNLGAGTNQDAIVITRPSDSRLYLSNPAFGAYTEGSQAGSMTASLTLSASAVSFPDRFASVAIQGTGLVQPAGY